MPHFLDSKQDKSVIFECFTTTQDESDALKALHNIESYTAFKNQVKKVLPTSVKNVIKKVLK